MAQETLSASGFWLRLLFAQALVLLTINPSGFSYAHWLLVSLPHINAGHAIAGLVLLVGWVIYVSATLRSLGLLGVTLIVALFVALVWLAVELGWMGLGNPHTLAWIALVIAGVVLGTGMCWSFVRRRLSGQADVDEVNRH